MSISQQRQGELLILGEAVLWSFFPILTILTYQNISPLISLAGSIVFSAVFFAILMTIRQKWHEIGNISALKDVFFVALFIGVLYYVFYFYGLKYICKFLGFSWTGALQSGGESIDWYERWCASGDREVLRQIVQYNEDDVRATLFLKEWLDTHAREVTQYETPYPWQAR